MRITLAFDVYGTLIDTNGVIKSLETMIDPDQANNFSNLWRAKQLEYTFRRSLMKRYQDFSVCTKEALEYTCDSLGIQLGTLQKQQLFESYRVLPAFMDTIEALQTLDKQHYQLVAFSNGKADAVRDLLDQADILSYFEDIVSVDEIKSFKPDPNVYLHLLTRCNSETTQTWLVSGNPFDVIGAQSAGLGGIWLSRDEHATFDPWAEFVPDINIHSLTEILTAIEIKG